MRIGSATRSRVSRGHPNVVHLEDVLQTDDGKVILVMEFMSGGSIDGYARHVGGSLPLEQTLMVGECAASALSAAHGKGIVHRDIKPQNLLVNSFGHVKVCDFGISSLGASAEFADRTDALSYRYASPEEIRGDEHVGPLTDVYSLGVTLANLLTGRHVSHETAGRLLEPASTPSSSANDAAGQERAFREILVACLSADLDDRPDSEALARQLSSLSAACGPARVRQLPNVNSMKPTDRAGAPGEVAASPPPTPPLATSRAAPPPVSSSPPDSQVVASAGATSTRRPVSRSAAPERSRSRLAVGLWVLVGLLLIAIIVVAIAIVLPTTAEGLGGRSDAIDRGPPYEVLDRLFSDRPQSAI